MKVFTETKTNPLGVECVRRFLDMDGGAHYKWIYFAMGGKEYPVGGWDIVCRHEIDWANTKESEVANA